MLSFETYGYSGQDGFHAMILSGYDDSKNAFKVINSWSSGWGEDGTIWVDYDFFANEFCFGAFVGNSLRDDPDPDDDNDVDDVTEGDDLLAWELEDMDYQSSTDPDADDPLWRTAKYNVFNSGENTIAASRDWNILVIYYNAYDAEDYGIILYDVYSDDYGSMGEDGSFDDIGVTPPDQGQMASWWNHIDVPAGKSVAGTLYDDPEARFQWTYKMPTVTGDYYLVTIADGFDVIDEEDEENNYFFLTDANGEPLQYENGILKSDLARKKVSGKPGKFAKGPAQTAVTKANPNTYTPQEIMRMVQYHKKTGQLKNKVDKYLETKGKMRK